MFNRKHKKQEIEEKTEVVKQQEIEVPKEDTILYIVTDRPLPDLLRYFRENGVNVSNIFSTIEDVRDAVLIQTRPCRIAIIDTGLGKFTATKVRKNLIDLLGICDEHNRVTVFYSDSVIKMEAIEELGKNRQGIDWFRYPSTVGVVATLLKYRERYIQDYGADKTEQTIQFEDIESLKGFKSKDECGEAVVVDWVTKEMLEKKVLVQNDSNIESYKITI